MFIDPPKQGKFYKVRTHSMCFGDYKAYSQPEKFPVLCLGRYQTKFFTNGYFLFGYPKFINNDPFCDNTTYNHLTRIAKIIRQQYNIFVIHEINVLEEVGNPFKP